MTVRTYASLHCDSPGCRASFATNRDRPFAVHWTTVREWAANAGWTYRTIRPPHGDFCPLHGDAPRHGGCLHCGSTECDHDWNNPMATPPEFVADLATVNPSSSDETGTP